MRRTITYDWTNSVDRNDKRKLEVVAEIFGPIAFHRGMTRVDVLTNRKATGTHQLTHVPTGLLICDANHLGLTSAGLRDLAKLLGNDPVWNFQQQPTSPSDCSFLMGNLRQYSELVKGRKA